MSSIPAIATGIVCSEYKHETNQFIFLSKNNDFNNTEDFYVNIYNNSNSTLLRPVPLLGIRNYPNATNLHFGGLCSYSQSTLYLNFEETTSNKSTTTLIYRLQLDNTTSLPVQFQKEAIELFDVTLSSFIHAVGQNDTSNLAYISTSKNQQNSLTLINLDHPSRYSTKNISGLGLLAVGGTRSQSLYFIQSNAVDLYNLDTLQYSHTTIQTNTTLEGLRRGTTGHVFSNNNSTKEYVSFYHPNSGQMDIFDIDASLIKYVPASVTRQGYLDLNINATATTLRQSSNASHLDSLLDKRNNLHEPSKRSILKALSNKFYLKKGAVNKVLQKRAVESSNSNMQSSSDGAINYRTSQIVSDSGERLPQAALLVPASSIDGTYDYALFSNGGDSTQFTVTTESSRSRTTLAATSTPTPSYTRILGIGSSAASNLGGGAIAGIVISVVAFIAIIAGLLVYSKKRKDKAHSTNNRNVQPEMSGHDNSSTPLSFQPQDFVGASYSGGVTVTRVDENHTNTSSILQAATSIPDEYRDGSRPDIRPLSYSEDTIDYAQLSNEELLQLEPDVVGPLFLFSGSYTSAEEEKATYVQDGYAIRTFDAKNGIKHTVHYFSASHLDTFVRSVHTVLQTSRVDSRFIKSERAIVLNSPTPHNQYQYIWITSPMNSEHSLYHLLFEEKQKRTSIDYRHNDFKIWSIYSILKSVETIHSQETAHLAIDPSAFYIEHEMEPTDWRLGNLGYARSKTRPRGKIAFPLVDSQFTAPEIIQLKDRTRPKIQLEAVDMWSLGCVIYAVATGGLLLFKDVSEVERLSVFRDDMEHHVKAMIQQNVESDVFQNVLKMMLQVDPSARKSIESVLGHWTSVYNMDE